MEVEKLKLYEKKWILEKTGGNFCIKNIKNFFAQIIIFGPKAFIWAHDGLILSKSVLKPRLPPTSINIV